MKRKPDLLARISILFLGLLFGACNPDTTDLKNTATVKATDAPLPAETTAAVLTTAGPTSVPCALSIPGEQGWPVTLCETFDDNRNAWIIESQDNSYAQYSITVEDGVYALDYTAKSFALFQRNALTWFDLASAKDFALTVSTRMDSRFQSCSWGVAFRANENSFFLFSIYNDNSYAFEIYENNTWVPLISKRAYSGIRTGEENTVAVIAEGQDFEFYINGELVNSFSGGLLQGSDILLIASAKEGVGVTYAFDDIALKVKTP